jgi:hypothetical protein
MRLRWLLALCLVLLPCLHRAAAVRPSDLPSSSSGEVGNTCASSPTTVPYLSASPVVQLTPITAKDSKNVTYTVTVAAYNYGNQNCSAAQPSLTESTTSSEYTILLVSVVGPSGAVTGLGLSSFNIQMLLPKPGYFVCGDEGLELCDLPLDDIPGDNLLQPAPSYGADGTSTVWGFGSAYDLTAPGPVILNSNYPAYYGTTYPIFGGVAVLSAFGPICSAGNTTGCNNITAATPFSVTFLPPGGLAAVTASSSNFTPLASAPISVSSYNLKATPLTVTAATSPTVYNASANTPALSDGAPSPSTINSQLATSYTFSCSVTTPSTLQQYLPVWFQFTPTASSKVFVSTAGSHYDTVLSVASPATCDDDTTSTTGAVTSSLTFSATQGTPYQILATEYPPCANQTSPGTVTGIPCAMSSYSDSYVAPLSGDSTLYLLVSTPQLNDTPLTLTAFASTAVGQTSTATQTVTLTSNTANFGATGITGITAATTGDFKVTPAACATPLPDAGTPCTLTVSFAPAASGARTGTLVISSSGATAAGNTPITLQLSGTGAASTPAVSFSPATTLTFTTPQLLNTTSAISDAVLTNTGTGPLTVTSIIPSGDFSQTNNCATVSPIAPNGSCTIMATFTPTAAGTRTGQLTVTDNAPNSPQTYALSGTGILPAPTITFSIANQTYGAAPFTVSAASNSTGTFTYSVVSGNATVSGSTVTLTGIGPVTVQASQAASASYAAATQNATFTVAAGAPTITFAVANQTLGAAPFSVSATSNSTGAFTYSVISGSATVSGATVTLTGAGSVTLQASEAAAGNYAAATQNASFTIAKATPAAALTASPNPILIQNTLTLTATVQSPAGAPTGSVAFTDGTTPLGTATLTAGVATLTVSTLAAGSHSLAAVYSGDTNFNTANSSYSETVEDFTLAIGTSGASQTVQPGGTASYSFPMTPSGGTTFPAVVNFTTTGVPSGFTATFNPASLAAGSSATTVALMIQVPTSALLQKPAPPARTLTLVAFALLLPLLTGIRRANPRLRRLALAVVLLAAAAGATLLTGCGGGSGGGGGTTTPPTQTYTITVTATSGADSHSTPVTLIVP